MKGIFKSIDSNRSTKKQSKLYYMVTEMGKGLIDQKLVRVT